MAASDQKPKLLPYLEGEGEWLCRPYCLSHSSLSFSRRSRSLNTEPLGQTVATHTYQTVHLRTHTEPYFMRILRAMARSSPSRSCKTNTKQWGEMEDNKSLFLQKNEHTPVVCVPAAGSSPGRLSYPPWLQDGEKT